MKKPETSTERKNESDREVLKSSGLTNLHDGRFGRLSLLFL